ncbi:MAG: LysR family transcriptional regulator [Polyangiales bacterium]
MHGVNLQGLDLNLLRLLDALLAERHLTRAAKRVGLSQPAMSHGLARLRKHLGDPLFVRTRQGLEPTDRAARLGPPLRDALASIERALAGDTFDPATARRTFSLATADYGAFVLLPRLLERLGRLAPGVDLWTRTIADDAVAQLAAGEADATLAVPTLRGGGTVIHSRVLYEERFVCVVREGHPKVKKRLDLDTWASLPHAFVAPGGKPGGVVDDVLAQHGKQRRVACAVPHFLLAPHVVASSDLVLTVGARVAEAFAKVLPLRVVEAPVALPGFRMSLAWHERQHRDPAQRWFRAQVAEAAKGA